MSEGEGDETPMLTNAAAKAILKSVQKQTGTLNIAHLKSCLLKDLHGETLSEHISAAMRNPLGDNTIFKPADSVAEGIELPFVIDFNCDEVAYAIGTQPNYKEGLVPFQAISPWPDNIRTILVSYNYSDEGPECELRLVRQPIQSPFVDLGIPV